MAHICKWCNKSFTTSYNLEKHTKTAKYCLKIQGKEIATTAEFECQYCQRRFIHKHHLKTHKRSCERKEQEIKRREIELEVKLHSDKYFARVKKIKRKTKKNLEETKAKLEECYSLNDQLEEVIVKQNARIRELELQLAEGKGKIEGFEKGVKTGGRPITLSNTNNNYGHPKLANIPITNIQPLTESYIKSEIAEKYTYEIFLGAEPALAKFIIDMLILENPSVIEELDDYSDEELEIVPYTTNFGLERNYACTDYSRNKFYRLVESKMWETDAGGKFIHKILDELADVASDHYKTLMKAERAAASREEREDILRKIEEVKYMFFGFAPSIGKYRERLFADVRCRIKDSVPV